MPGILLDSADVHASCAGVLLHRSGFLSKDTVEVVPSLADKLAFRKSTSGEETGAFDDFSWLGPDKVVALSVLILAASSLLEDSGSFTTAVTDTSLSPSFCSFVKTSSLLPESPSLSAAEVLAGLREKVKEAETSFFVPSDAA